MADLKLVTKEEQLPKDLLDSNVRLFLCTTDTKLVATVLAVATTISTSLGPIMPKVVVPHFENSKKAEKVCTSVQKTVTFRTFHLCISSSCSSVKSVLCSILLLLAAIMQLCTCVANLFTVHWY
jgi:hypothetical protein